MGLFNFNKPCTDGQTFDGQGTERTGFIDNVFVNLEKGCLLQRYPYDNLSTCAKVTENAKHTSLQLLADQLNIDNVDLAQLDELMKKATKPLTVVDKKYMICFLAGEKVQQIADRFIVEPASVYTVRYRLKKKFPKDEPLPF
ncbi:MAG: hypothetical protein MJZ85_04770 [Bacteroidales bacterium]|nr:hypothetical protein [Bacteroidales bacterium]